MKNLAEWREIIWRRKLTPAETAELREYLATHPEVAGEWEAELALNQVLDHLPEAPRVSSNFTARVMEAVRLEAAAQARAKTPQGFGWQTISRWLPRTAVACLIVTACLFAYHEHEQTARLTLAHDVVRLTAAVSPDMMEDFEAIRRMGDTPVSADTDIIRLMQ